MSINLRCILLFMFGCVGSISAKGCHDTLRELAAYQAKFVQCTVDNSPVSATCVSCYQPHNDMTGKYEFLVKNCSDIYINKNRLNVVYNMQKSLLEIWNKGFCDYCFENGAESNSTKEFKAYKTEFDNCLHNAAPSEACIKCKPIYIVLNDFYREMDEEKQGKICFDLQDIMNQTRLTWSKDLKCCRREFSLTLFIVGSSLLGALPLIFYLGMYSYTKRQERNHGVLDSTFGVAENEEPIASTSGISSGTQENLPSQPEINTTPAVEEHPTPNNLIML